VKVVYEHMKYISCHSIMESWSVTIVKFGQEKVYWFMREYSP
jgi:hypothetical protein